MSVETLLAVERALQQLADLDEGLCRLVELRFFGGLTEAETACVLGVSERTVRRNWRKAKAVLAHTLAAKNDNEREAPV
ncbi:MAG: ECF-type sigma factor, partial [Pseudomonadales bacterium]